MPRMTAESPWRACKRNRAKQVGSALPALTRSMEIAQESVEGVCGQVGECIVKPQAAEQIRWLVGVDVLDQVNPPQEARVVDEVFKREQKVLTSEPGPDVSEAGASCDS